MEQSKGHSSKSGKAPADSRRKKVYARPALKEYGKVTNLIKGGSISTMSDSGSNMMFTSDRSVKENVVRIDTHPLGIGLYLFDYKPAFRDACGHGRQFGVMADEVETVMPAAVSVAPRGHKQVDYALLGITRPAR